MTPAAFRATYSDFKIVKGRKIAQVILELPLELADAALAALGGVPRPDAETWVAVARIDPTKGASEPSKAAETPPKAPRRFNTLSLPQQIGILCQEKAFEKFLIERMFIRDACPNCAMAIRYECDVESRSDILPGTRAAEKWFAIEDAYLAWLQVDA